MPREPEDDDDDLREDIGDLEPWPKLLQISADLAVQPRKVAAVKRSGHNDDHCVVFLSGHSPTEGFVVPRPIEEVTVEINAALVGDDVPEFKVDQDEDDADADPDDPNPEAKDD
jgi:hypothetical protein